METLCPFPPLQLDWPALVRAIVQALDDIGCRPRQFSARQARAIRASQAALGYTDALWEGWKELAAREAAPPAPAPESLGEGALAALLEGLGLKSEDVDEDGRDELWGAGEDVFVWSSASGAAHGGARFAAGARERGNASAIGAGGGRTAAQLPGIVLDGIPLRDIHLVPVTGGDGWEGARTPFFNVRAKCAPQQREFSDRSPWD